MSTRTRPEGQQFTVMTQVDAAIWRTLAAECGYVNTRGTGSGEMGNIRALVHALAEAERTAPLAFRAKLAALLALGGEEPAREEGGKSYERYPTSFSDTFRQAIRERDGHTCQLCGAAELLAVHHINYVKGDTTPDNCITLCASCHGKTNANRPEWQAYFEQYMQTRHNLTALLALGQSEEEEI